MEILLNEILIMVNHTTPLYNWVVYAHLQYITIYIQNMYPKKHVVYHIVDINTCQNAFRLVAMYRWIQGTYFTHHWISDFSGMLDSLILQDLLQLNINDVKRFTSRMGPVCYIM